MPAGSYVVRALIEPGRRRAGRFWPSSQSTVCELTDAEHKALSEDSYISVKPAPKADESPKVDDPPKAEPPKPDGKKAKADESPKVDDPPKAKA